MAERARDGKVRQALGIIGGTGFELADELREPRRRLLSTPYGEPSAELLSGRLRDTPVVALQRHGAQRNIPPHKVNYRANVWALREAGVRRIVAIAAVGGIGPEAAPGRLVIPDQLIDYTYGRAHTFFEDGLEAVRHVEFAEPYSPPLRELLLEAARARGIEVVAGGTYAVTQGPRLESAAEIDRLERDGCTVVGMTGMPEAALARELDLQYACCAVVANRAAGRTREPISMDAISAQLSAAMHEVRGLLLALAERVAEPSG